MKRIGMTHRAGLAGLIVLASYCLQSSPRPYDVAGAPPRRPVTARVANLPDMQQPASAIEYLK